jgi:tyrocidine synthetase-3
LLPNGKIDRKSLPIPTVESAIFIAPSSPAEIAIADGFRHILGVTDISILDDFFELGGDSLHAIRLVHFLVTNKHIELNINDIFAYRTIFSLSRIAESDNISQSQLLPPLKPADTQKENASFPLSYGQHRLWMGETLQRDSVSAYNVPILIDFPGFLDVGRLENAFRLLLERHKTLRCAYYESEGDVFQRVRSIDSLNWRDFWSVVDFSHLSQEDAIEKMNEFVKNGKFEKINCFA